MGSLTKLPSTGLGTGGVGSSNINDGDVTENKIGSNAVTTGKISDGTVSTNDLASTLDLSSKTVSLSTSTFNTQNNNIALLGFKMAVNESLTVFNLVDGVVDEFNDETGTDESEGSNDLYNATDDYYINSTQPDGTPMASYSAGFGIDSITEPDTSSAGTNPSQGAGSTGSFTVPTDLTSIDYVVIGAGGARANALNSGGGGGGATRGTLAVTPGQTLHVSAGEGGDIGNGYAFFGGGYFASGSHGGGGGNAGIFAAPVSGTAPQVTPSTSVLSAPQIYTIAGAGGGAGNNGATDTNFGGSGGGLTGDAGFYPVTDPGLSGGNAEQTTGTSEGGGGGDQEQGGQGQPGSTGGSFLTGGPAGGAGAGGAGYYGGGGGNPNPSNEAGAGGGGSSYIGHPQITGASTEEGSTGQTGAAAYPEYPSINDDFPFTVGAGNGGPVVGGPGSNEKYGGNGYVLITGTIAASALNTTIVSSTFTATSEPSTARIVVFEENVDTPTLNTDIIASVSRDGTNFSNATLSDSGYVTGSSGQRILTGTVDISGQPTGTSMRWKLALANNQIKIHGVSLSWA